MTESHFEQCVNELLIILDKISVKILSKQLFCETQKKAYLLSYFLPSFLFAL